MKPLIKWQKKENFPTVFIVTNHLSSHLEIWRNVVAGGGGGGAIYLEVGSSDVISTLQIIWSVRVTKACIIQLYDDQYKSLLLTNMQMQYRVSYDKAQGNTSKTDYNQQGPIIASI